MALVGGHRSPRPGHLRPPQVLLTVWRTVRGRLLRGADPGSAVGPERHAVCTCCIAFGWSPDGRLDREFKPPNKLSAEERTQVLDVANSAEFGHLPPSQIVPILADRGEYVASESTFYRVLREHRQLNHRQCQPARYGPAAPESLEHDGTESGLQPICTLPLAPEIGLCIEIVQITPGAGRKEGAANILNRALDPTLFITPGHRNGSWFEAIMSGQI